MSRQEYHRLWYGKNKKKKDVQNRAWRKKNNKRQKFLSRRWYRKNRDRHIKRCVVNARKRFHTPAGRKKRNAYNSRRWNMKSKKQRTEASRRVERWRKQNPERAKSTTLKHHYGITFEEFSIMLKAQGHRCAICKKRFRKIPNVDHDHKTKIVRGLLCGTCNIGLGMFKDSSVFLESASGYLRRDR